MERPNPGTNGPGNGSRPAEIVDFDRRLLEACGPQVRAELLQEARFLADVFGGRDANALHLLAEQLSSGLRDSEMARGHARLLAAALKQLAEEM